MLPAKVGEGFMNDTKTCFLLPVSPSPSVADRQARKVQYTATALYSLSSVVQSLGLSFLAGPGTNFTLLSSVVPSFQQVPTVHLMCCLDQPVFGLEPASANFRFHRLFPITLPYRDNSQTHQPSESGAPPARNPTSAPSSSAPSSSAPSPWKLPDKFLDSMPFRVAYSSLVLQFWDLLSDLLPRLPESPIGALYLLLQSFEDGRP